MTAIKALPALGQRRTLVLAAVAVVGCATAVGSLAALRPSAALAVIVLVYGAVAFALVVGRLGAPYSVVSCFVVGGYICLTRGFAGLFLPLGSVPLLIGELTLLTLLPIGLLRLGWQVPARIMLPFAVWIGYCALLTARDFGQYRLDAIRDAAFWYYAGFVVIGAATWRELGTDRLRRWMAPVMAGALVVAPVQAAASMEVIPALEVPFADGPLLAERFDATAMHLIGGATLFLTARGMRRPPWSSWLGIAVAAGLIGLTALLQVRAAFVGLAGAVGVLVVYRLVRPVVFIGIALLLALGVLWALDVEMPSSRGVLSARSVVERQASTLLFLLGVNDREADPNDHAGTIEWRTIWWQALIEESLGNPTYLAIGRGFGADLVEAVRSRSEGSLNWDQGTDEGKPLRSPHNIAVTIFARTGLLGLGAWLVVLVVCFHSIVRATLAFRRSGDRDEELFGAWLLVYLLAMLLVAALGVVLESPFGAAPFFWVLGVGLAWAESRRAPEGAA